MTPIQAIRWADHRLRSPVHIRLRRLAIPAVIATSLLLAGCVSDQPSSGTPSPTSKPTSEPTPTIGPGNESTAKGEDPKPVPLEPVIVYAGYDEGSGSIGASGYVAGAIENGGTCTFTFTGPSTETVTSEGIADVTTTSCGNVELNADLVVSGTWTVVLSYASTATPAVSSVPSTVEVP